MYNKPEISIIIPAYNEAQRIEPTVLAISDYMSQLDRAYEIIVADDGSSDNTVALMQSLDIPHLRILKTKANGGKGSAVQRGMFAAQGDLLLFTDADNATPIEELAGLLTQIEQHNHDVAIGSRGIAGAVVENKSALRKAFSYGLNGIVRLALQMPYRDTQCGFKLFTRKAAHKLFGTQTMMGFSFDLELLYLAARFGYRVAEVPVHWHDVDGSTVDPIRETRRFLRDIITIRRTDLQGAYRQLPATTSIGEYAHA